MNLLKTILQVSFLVLFIFLGNTKSAAQTELSNLPITGQKVDQWCWATSMEMVMNYHNRRTNTSLINQCDVGIEYFELLKRIALSNASHDPDHIVYYDARIQEIEDNCSNPCSSALSNYEFNLSLEIEENNFKNILEAQGFTSIESSNLNIFDWEEYENEIDNSRPVILNYTVNDIDAGGTTYLHAVVAKGYYAHSTGTYFMVNDPLSICTGRKYLLNKAVYDGVQVISEVGSNGYPTPSNLEIESINSVVYEIKPKPGVKRPIVTIGTQIGDGFPPDNGEGHQALIAALEASQGQLIRGHDKGFFSLKLIQETLSKDHILTDVKFLSYPYLQEVKEELNLDEALIDKNFFEATYFDTENPLKTTIRCSDIGDTCIIERIELEEGLLAKPVVLNGQVILLDNRPSRPPTSIPYSIIKYFPYIMEFYRFNFQGQEYLVPKDDFSIDFFEAKLENGCKVLTPSEVLTALKFLFLLWWYSNSTSITSSSCPSKPKMQFNFS